MGTEKSSEDEGAKALALMAVIEMFGADMPEEDPDSTAVLMELYLKGYNASKP